ncbi:2-phosphosulfolactate phosphatase [Aquibacillus rhizosphaerae]|uniref:Probable 2-phosphosulfolactate phosphatase n=1 Tax=Aquibacillus rhizosphaerae TaxID=3051431 RepID=A0ABT7LAX0_9BACI|nr:2-phosphosulfolactate phosphatase [Aquibacillus sp. LR5S19]MDL4843012.1 2-phosphosulfolactate phosphatase [Aquibacillus sp. LR5S19]
MLIDIYQGRNPPPTVAPFTIVIDVIRAFTVAHFAFLQGANRIFLAESVEQALKMKRDNPALVLAGEVAGLPIEGFDLENSPTKLQNQDLIGETLVLKTTNGVRATLNCLSSNHVFVTGFSNAKRTALYVKERIAEEKLDAVNVIASHPSGDDDLACAEYIKSIIDGSNSISTEEVINRIKQSHVADKFFNVENPIFKQEDIFYCTKELDGSFIMKVKKNKRIPMIERVNV